MKRSTAITVVALMCIAGYVAVQSVIHYGGCHWYGYQTDRTVRYAMGVGCMVKKESGWTPKAELRTEQ